MPHRFDQRGQLPTASGAASRNSCFSLARRNHLLSSRLRADFAGRIASVAYRVLIRPGTSAGAPDAASASDCRDAFSVYRPEAVL
jgi:hypothetical protein